MAQRVTSSRFIGRRRELAELERSVSDDDGELPSLVFIAGESGVGKTRLLRELIASMERQGGRALGGACIELGEGELPYAPLVTALRPLQRGDDPVLAGLPDSTRAELSRLVPELGEPPGETEADRGEAQRRLFDAFLELVARLGDERPSLLWIEDIHWADRSTRAFLRYLAASLGAERALVVATYRSDELHRRHPLRPMLAELERSPRARRVELERFDRGEVSDQLADILGRIPEPEVVERMYARSEGNPLFTEELLAAGVDARGPLPPSLREALLLRVERLPDESQQLLRLLAAVGAYLVSAEAELGRATGEDAGRRWAAAVRAWEDLSRPYPAAVARWRQGAAELAAGDRDAATGSIAAAIQLAESLGARWLATEAVGLATRARIDLAAAADRVSADVDGAAPEPFGLTPREHQVLALLASGATNREIAGELFMAEKTASVHVSRILSKLDVRSRTEAAAVAHRHGIVATPG